jgi:anti-sigma regulatory factor (Ser/Thr protein kinase)
MIARLSPIGGRGLLFMTGWRLASRSMNAVCQPSNEMRSPSCCSPKPISLTTDTNGKNVTDRAQRVGLRPDCQFVQCGRDMCDTTARSTVNLSSNPTSARVAREFLKRAACGAHGAAVLDAAILLTSEAVTNAVLYGGPPIVLAVDCTGAQLEVRVCDGSIDMPRPRHPDELATGGRGLMLIDVLSDEWGVDVTGAATKEVWFHLAAQSATSAD